MKRKSFNELVGVESDREHYDHIVELVEEIYQEKEFVEGDELPDYPDISDEEVDKRAEVFLRAFKVVETIHRQKINNLSLQINKKALEGYPVKELIEFYNEQVRAILDDFTF